MIEAKKSRNSKNAAGLSLHHGCQFASRDVNAVPTQDDPLAPLSSPIDDPALNELIADIISEMFIEDQDERSSSSHTTTTTDASGAFT